MVYYLKKETKTFSKKNEKNSSDVNKIFIIAKNKIQNHKSDYIEIGIMKI